MDRPFARGIESASGSASAEGEGVRAVRSSRRAGPRRARGRLRRVGRRARPDRRRQALHLRPKRRERRHGAPPARRPGRGRPRPPEHRGGAGGRRARGAAVGGHGVRPGSEPRPGPEEPGAHADRARAGRLAAAVRGTRPRAPRGCLPSRPEARRCPHHTRGRGQGGGFRLVAPGGPRAAGTGPGRGGPALPRPRDTRRASARPQGRHLLGRRDRLRAHLVPQGLPGRQHDRRGAWPDPWRARPRLPAPNPVHTGVRARARGEPRALSRGAPRLLRGRPRRSRSARARHRASTAQLLRRIGSRPSRARGAPRRP